MREIALDTETTGLDPRQGHRIVEIGCVEMIDRKRTGNVFHHYINPARDMPEEAFRIHGLSNDFLKDKPLFEQSAQDFLAFIGESPLIIHNASFDMKFINFELQRLKLPEIKVTPVRVVDTLILARKKFPGSPASLDALCKRYKIDLSSRTKHGALLDAELLTDVYIELIGGSQSALLLDPALTHAKPIKFAGRKPRPSRNFTLTSLEYEQHSEHLKKIKDPLWNRNPVADEA
jgi:DNA polymerase-3 subunit epsilon